jgi:hypothetical protein
MADRDGDDDEEYLHDLVYRAPRTGEQFELEPLPLPAVPLDTDPRDYVRSLFREPLLGETPPPPPPTLRSAATELFLSSGLYGNAPSPYATRAAATSADADAELLPPSWKLPAGNKTGFTTILGDDTAVGAAAPNKAPVAAAPSAAPRDPAAPASPLDHPDAQTGLALTAADTLLRQGIDLAVNLAAGNLAVARKLVELAANSIAGMLPEQYRASALRSADAAAAEAEQRVADNDRATRTRAALGTLAHRRVEAELDHSVAVINGDQTKIGESRRDALNAWRAERRARGDGEAEINAGARVLEAQYRKTALQHRFAQLNGADIQRALDEDEDANADPALAREVADDILRIRRDDPARAGEASIEREIAEKKRDGRIDTPEEETAYRYKRRLEAQAQRGIPEGERRLLINQERTRLAAEYLRIESHQGKAAADAWLASEVSKAGPHAERFELEVAAGYKPRDFEKDGSGLSASGPPPQLAGLPGAEVDALQSSPRADGESNESEASRKRIEAEDRRQPEPPASVSAELGVEQPPSPLRKLRKLIGRVRSVSAFKDGGEPLMSDDEVVAYIEEARKYIRPEYQDILEITVLAVRSGMIPWWRAQERLREYFAPESTGEAILDGILDFTPIVGQVKGAIEIGDALDGLRIAVNERDEAGAVKFAAEAALLIAGLLPILKVGKFAKHIPGLEKLKDILGEFAGGRLPFQRFHELWDEGLKLQKHH